MSPRLCTYHCASCHSHFSSLESFDVHRTGDHATGRSCLPPDDVPTLVVAGEGECRMYREPVAGAVIYTTRRSVGRAAQAFGTTPQPLALSDRRPPTPLPDREAA